METPEHKRHAIQHLFKRGYQVALTDLLDRTDDFELGDFIRRVDVIDPFAAVQIALMNRVYADIARFALGLGLAALTDVGGRGPGLFEVASLALIRRRFPQVIQVADRDTSQRGVLALAKKCTGALRA